MPYQTVFFYSTVYIKKLNFNLLSGKTALITGASSGIGKETALTFARNGANLILISRNEEKLKKLLKDLEKFNVLVDYYAIDITNAALLENLFSQLKKSKVIIDIVINNAGIMEDAVLQMVKTESIKRTFDTNVFALIDISKRASRLMIRNKKGSIINLSSIIFIIPILIITGFRAISTIFIHFFIAIHTSRLKTGFTYHISTIILFKSDFRN